MPPKEEVAVFRLNELFGQEGISGPDLILPENGKRVYPLLAKAMKGIPPGRALHIDFSDVQLMDASFAGETVMKLAAALCGNTLGDRFLVLVEPNDATLQNLEGAALRRRLPLLVRRKRGTALLGRLQPALRETWSLATGSKTITARALADRLGLEISNASTRLAKLHKQRLLARAPDTMGSGKQHVYFLPD